MDLLATTTTVALLLLAPCVAASDPDCPGTYTGYSLKTGTGCKEYVYCQGGVATSTTTCPSTLIYSGKVGEGGICNYPAAVPCDSEAAAAAPAAMASAAAAAAAPAATASAPADDLAAMFQSWLAENSDTVVESVAAAVVSNGDDDYAYDDTANGVEQSAPGVEQMAPGIDQEAAAAGPPTGFCGTSWTDASAQCKQTCTTDQDCCNPSERCFSTDACSANSAGAGHYYCGTSWCGALQACSVACPSGTDEDCPAGQGCFADIPCAPSDISAAEAASWTQAGANPVPPPPVPAAGTPPVPPPAAATPATGDASPNPHHYYCGTDQAEAAVRCQPCPGGTMQECGDDFASGCFIGVAACADAGGAGAPAAAATEPVPAPVVPAAVPAPVVPAPEPAAVPAPVVPAAVPAPVVPAAVPEPAVPAAVPAPAPAPAGGWTNMPFNPSPSSSPKTVIGYYASWQWYDRNKLADPPNIDFSKYGRINYAFFQPDTEGNLYGTDEWADPQLLWGPYDWSGTGPQFCSWDAPGPGGRNCNSHDTSKGMIALAHDVGTEVWPSIGGWTLSDNFPGIAASAAKREHFARQCVEMIEEYDFDGIDIDWEYPGYAAHSGTPADTVNYTLFLQAIKDQLAALAIRKGRSQGYGLTAALPCGPDKIAKIEVGKIKDVLTELNLMTYDLHGSWDTLTGINAPMFDQGWTDETPRWSVHGCVNNYVELGVPLGQLNMGLPFYGRSFRGATGMKQHHEGADDINYHLDEGSPQYFNIVNELKRLTTYRHEKTQTQYAVFDDGNRGLVSYDDPQAICDKVHYANERGMAGFLVWEISGDMVDYNGQISTPLIDATNQKIQNPSFDCSSLRDPSWALKDSTYNLAPPEPTDVDWSGYVAPSGTGGSGNDFNGAAESTGVAQFSTQISIPAPAPSPALPNVAPSSNAIYLDPVVPSAPAGSSGNDGCPAGLTGYTPVDSCKGYVYCQGGAMVGQAQSCSTGTLYDVNTMICNHAGLVNC